MGISGAKLWRTAVLLAATSVWWLSGLWVEGRYGLNVLQYTETVQDVSRTLFPFELLRGLGYWMFYGRDPAGAWNDAAALLARNPLIVVCTLLVPAAALLAGAVLRWRHRFLFVALIVSGLVIGVAAALVFTGTTLNIESFMGSIMCIGVSVSNSVMMITFMNDRWREGMPVGQAAVVGAAGRLRPIIMTACAMTTGMLPMALALEEGSQMQAPLGRAVIGGLVCSTLCTLLILPALFRILIGSGRPPVVSIDPDDPDSPAFDGNQRHDGGSSPVHAEAQP